MPSCNGSVNRAVDFSVLDDDCSEQENVVDREFFLPLEFLGLGLLAVRRVAEIVLELDLDFCLINSEVTLRRELDGRYQLVTIYYLASVCNCSYFPQRNGMWMLMCNVVQE